jgi:uncharacterized membrane protein YphA (DoxX/SURF4 family)
VARVCLVVIFPFSGLDKILNWSSALKQAESSFLPGGAMLLVLAMMVEFVTPVCIVSGWYDGFAAFVLAGYCVITAILYHNFWKVPALLVAGQRGLPAPLGLPEELRPRWRPDFDHSRQRPGPGDRACCERHRGVGRRANSARLTARRAGGKD